ncbi:phosphopantetheine-binding protein [Nocardia sp. NPDC005366]|uniref:acyl carrier protein n=1 Tax=Nocardia sp. NPDC005366 TaxID=3156878 RepID=UPI0033BC1FFD
MPETLTRDQADQRVRTALRGFGSDAEVAALTLDEPLRGALDLDSIDFLTFVERLSQARGSRIEEDDYPRLVSIRSCVDYLLGTTDR